MRDPKIETRNNEEGSESAASKADNVQIRWEDVGKETRGNRSVKSEGDGPALANTGACRPTGSINTVSRGPSDLSSS